MVISARACSDEVPESLRIRIFERLTLLAGDEQSAPEDDPRIGQPPALEA
jgi:hypothetical protein